MFEVVTAGGVVRCGVPFVFSHIFVVDIISNFDMAQESAVLILTTFTRHTHKTVPSEHENIRTLHRFDVYSILAARINYPKP